MKIKHIITFILAIVVLFSSFSGCANKGGEKREVYNGTHIFTATETSDYVVEKGKSDYVVVIPQKASKLIQQAKTEFVYLFKKATNVSLRVVEEDDSGIQHSSTAKYISIGRTKMFESSGLEADYLQLGRDGGKIMTKDKTIYIVGGLDNGTLYTVYTFMQLEFNFEQYFIDCFEIDENVSELKLKNYEVTDIPDIPIRENGSGLLGNSYYDYDKDNAAKRMKMGNGLWATQFPIHKDFDKSSPSLKVHNSMYYLPKNLYGDHKDWYAVDGGQLCYTARGNEESLTQMIQACADKIIFSLKTYDPINYPQYNVATLTMEDNYLSCKCDKCKELALKYGTESGAVILFANRLADVVVDWMNKPENAEYKREDFHVMFFAYHNFVNAPTVYNSRTGKYEPVAPEVVFNDHVGVYLAPIGAFYNADIKDEENKETYDNIEGWSVLSNYTFYWLYATNFSYYNYLYDTMNFYTGDLYAYLANRDAKYLFTQQQHDQSGTSTAWHNLKIYLDAKLSWDCSLDENELVDNWFNAMFKEAAPIMKNLYYAERSWTQYIFRENKMAPSGVYGKIENRKFWPLTVLQDWTARCDLAMETVAHYKESNQKLYDEIYFHVYSEWIFPAYAILMLWDNNSMTTQQRSDLIAQFKEVLSVVDKGGNMLASDYDAKYKDFINGL